MPRQKILHADLSSPCADCPFRNDGEGVMLNTERAQEIADSLSDDRSTFACHKTLHAKKRQHCAGAMITLLHDGMPNIFMRIFQPTLNMLAPVCTSLAEFVQMQGTSIMNRSRGRHARADDTE